MARGFNASGNQHFADITVNTIGSGKQEASSNFNGF